MRCSFLSFLILTLNTDIHIIAIEKVPIFIERGSEAIAQSPLQLRNIIISLRLVFPNSRLPTPMLKHN
jgi:hypothetical protein